MTPAEKTAQLDAIEVLLNANGVPAFKQTDQGPVDLNPVGRVILLFDEIVGLRASETRALALAAASKAKHTAAIAAIQPALDEMTTVLAAFPSMDKHRAKLVNASIVVESSKVQP